MEVAGRHTFQVLTKRPERMGRLVRDYAGGLPWPLPNVWLGVSVENQRMADERIPVLLDTPAAVRFLSCEPLLGPLSLEPYLPVTEHTSYKAARGCLKLNGLPRISWVICGGESGPGSAKRKLVERCWHDTGGFYGDEHHGLQHSETEPLKEGDGSYHWCPKPQALEWVRSLRDQCVAAGVPFFFKQWGATTPKAAGRLLDGREWDEMPL